MHVAVWVRIAHLTVCAFRIFQSILLPGSSKLFFSNGESTSVPNGLSNTQL